MCRDRGAAMDKEVAYFMIYLVERIAEQLFGGRMTVAYEAMRDSGIWDFFVQTYETSHTLSVDYLTDDARRWFERSGISFAPVSR
jgi:hypothetical protein